MRKLVPILFIQLAACTSGQEPILHSYEVIRRDDHLGEYLQVESPNSLITVNRKGVIKGLVRVNIKTQEIQTINPLATEARDLLFRSGKLIYRIDEQVHFRNNEQHVELPLKAKKVRTFIWKTGYGRITYEDHYGISHWATLYEDGRLLATGELPGSGRSSLINSDEKELLVYQNDRGFSLGLFKDELSGLEKSFTIENGKLGSFAQMTLTKEGILIAYLDESKGVLKTALVTNNYSTFDIRLVDGTPNETFIGMDIAFFFRMEIQLDFSI